MSDFLLELRCEEIPARMQAGARRDLEKLFRAQMDEAGVAVGDLTVWSTPRRLALIARDLPDQTEAVREETKGPAAAAPEQALAGFLRKVGLSKDQLEIRDIKGKETWFAVVEKPGRAVRDVLAEAIPEIIRAFPWPKSQRWGAASISTESLRWVRPLSGIVAIFGDELVDCAVEGIGSTYATMGHRFHHPGEITIGGADDYADKLRACHVIVDHTERQDMIREGAAKAAQAAGLTLVEDEGLVVENAGLTEWPVPLLGRFDAEFLEVPPEVIQLTARTNQKYFVCTKPSPLQGRGRSREAAEGEGAGSGIPLSPTLSPEGERELANAFVCTANIEAADGGEAIIAGNRKVLAARLSDARFFWDQDRKKSLAEHAEGLGRITFHEKLGTVADKVDRVAKLARWLVEEGIVRSSPSSLGEGDRSTAGVVVEGRGAPSPLRQPPAASATSPSKLGEEQAELANLAEQAARLCKADLVTEMVGEFPELQGLMGGYYARAEGLPDAVADAIRDHYKPVGQGDDVPTAPVTVAVSLADKLDTLAGFFGIDERPTGSKDPYALRRAALAILSITFELDVRTNWRVLLVWVVCNLGSVHSGDKLFINGTIDPIAKAAQERGPHALWIAFDEQFPNTIPKDEFPPFNPRAEFTFVTEANVSETVHALLAFMIDRLKVQQREAGVRHDLIDAVFALGGEDDLVRLLARVHALQSFITTEDGTNLLAGYKRAANILKKEGFESVTPAQAGVHSSGSADGEMDSGLRRNDELAGGSAEGLTYTPEPAERALIDALDAAGPEAAAAVEEEDFAAAMAALASLRAPIDAFFDNVTVNDPDAEKRLSRLALLDRFRVAVHNVADFSKIEG